MFQLAAPEDDGLFIPEVGAWSAAKHHFLRRYIDAFTTAMKDKPWDGLHYIDLFSGAGIERLEGDGLDWGSPLIAAQAPNRFAQLHLCDSHQRPFGALSKRVTRFAQPQPPQLIRADANEAVTAIVATLPPKSLSLAFIDPYGLHCHLETLRHLAARRVDLVIFFPDHLDALRNWETVYAGNPDSNLDKALGTQLWHARLNAAPKDQWAFMLRQIYEEQIRTLGYTEFEYERIERTDGRPLYLLIFCSKDSTGRDLWRKVSLRKPGGQSTFDFT